MGPISCLVFTGAGRIHRAQKSISNSVLDVILSRFNCYDFRHILTGFHQTWFLFPIGHVEGRKHQIRVEKIFLLEISKLTMDIIVRARACFRRQDLDFIHMMSETAGIFFEWIPDLMPRSRQVVSAKNKQKKNRRQLYIYFYQHQEETTLKKSIITPHPFAKWRSNEYNVNSMVILLHDLSRWAWFTSRVT